MKYGLHTIFWIMMMVTCYGQTADIEYWRDMGYQSKLKHDYGKAIEYYQKILAVEPADYDAKLALARLFAVQEEFHAAISLFNEIYQNDSTDVEAMNGLGESYGLLGENEKSIFYYERALKYFSEDIQQYFYLAKAYENGGKLENAILVYEEINKIDDSYSEAWAGIGKMYYWKGMPATASSYYIRALELDPGNEEINKENQEVQQELKFGLTLKVSPLHEEEENYEITALVSTLKLEKRLNDAFLVEGNFLLDYSDRNFTDDFGDTTRWFNNVWVKGSWIKEHHKISAFAGYSATDDKFSTYGLNWILNYNVNPISIKNSITAGYDYFYYWNRVGAKSLSDEIQLGYKLIGLNAGYTYGVVDDVLVKDILNDSVFTHINPYNSFSISVNYKILKQPEIKVGANYSYLNYKYKSPLYYSPFGRNLTGGSVSIYYLIDKFYVYGGFSYNIGSEFNYDEADSGGLEKIKLNVNNWSANIEFGYNLYPFSLSIGGSNFYNPYYKNLTGFISAKMLF